MSKTSTSAHRVPPYKRPIIIGGFVVILAVVGVVTFLLFKAFAKPTEDLSHSNNPDSSKPVVGEINEPSSDPTTQLENKAPQYEGENPNELSELTGTITYADVDEETQTLHAAVMINQYLQSNGQCVFNLKRGDAVIRTASALAESDVTTSVCGPFKISVDGVAPGTYQIEVIITGDGKRGVITQDQEI